MKRFKIDVDENGNSVLLDEKGNKGKKMSEQQLFEELKKASWDDQKKVKVTENYTRIVTGSYVVCINGVWYYFN